MDLSYKSLSVYSDFIVLIQERRVSPQPVQQLIDSLTTKVEDLESEITTLESKNTTPHIDARKAVVNPLIRIFLRKRRAAAAVMN